MIMQFPCLDDTKLRAHISLNVYSVDAIPLDQQLTLIYKSLIRDISEFNFNIYSLIYRVIDEVCGYNLRARSCAPLFVASFWSNVSRRRTLHILCRVVQQYSILTCTQAFAGKSVPVITLMNGNKGRRGLYRAILCSLRDVLLRAVLSPSFYPATPPSLTLSSSLHSISRPLSTLRPFPSPLHCGELFD